MESGEEQQQQQQQQQEQIHGVVIITLPPPDDPSKGKTITAFTFTTTNHDYPSSNHDHSQQQHEQLTPPIQPNPPPQNPQSHLSSSNPFLDTHGRLLGFLGISLVAILLYGFAFSDTITEFRLSREDDGGDGDKTVSFLFPLYHKLGVGLQIKLGELVSVMEKGNFVEGVGQDTVKHQKVNGFVAAIDAGDDGSSTTIFPVRGNVYPDGLYFTYMLVGNPRRPYYLDIDTGSDLTWIQCDAPCSSCAKGANPLYKPTRSNLIPRRDSLCAEIQRKQRIQHYETSQQCDYEIDYADHSSSLGVLARDELHLTLPNGSLTKSDIVFGCAYDQQGLLLNTLAKTDGILGLSRSKVSLPSQLASKGIINNVVGHCLATDVDTGGYMFMGDDYVPQWGVAWIPMLDTPSLEFYQSEITKMNYGNSPLSLGGQNGRYGRVLFDTGSSYTYFTKDAYSELVASLAGVTDLGLTRDESDTTLPICWQTKVPVRDITDVKQFFKTITLQFGSKWWIISRKLQIPPEGYLIINGKGNVCLGILDGSKVHDGSAIILGDISLRGRLIVYDNENRRIGWVESHCVKPNGFQSFPSFEG